MKKIIKAYSLTVLDRIQRLEAIQLSLELEDLFFLLHKPLDQAMKVLRR
jgi:hypothetical protein